MRLARFAIPAVIGVGFGFFAGFAATYQFGILISAMVWGVVAIIALFLVIGGVSLLRRRDAAATDGGRERLMTAAVLVAATALGSFLGPLLGPAYRQPDAFTGTMDLSLASPIAAGGTGSATCASSSTGPDFSVQGSVAVAGQPEEVLVQVSFIPDRTAGTEAGVYIVLDAPDEPNSNERGAYYAQGASTDVRLTTSSDRLSGSATFTDLVLDPGSPGAANAPARLSGEVTWVCSASPAS